MKKLFSILVVGFVILSYACGGGGDDPKSVMKDFFSVMDDFFMDMEKAENADHIVAAINNYSEKMQKMTPRLKQLKEKYPELMNMKDVPEEFKEFEAKIKEMQPKMMGLMGKLMKYASDPKVQEAQKKMMEAMKSMAD
jgi:uncharacterized protein YjgD (DUF1641 family)